MSFFITPSGRYYEEDRVSLADIEVPKRPSQYHTWNGTEWIETDPAIILEEETIMYLGDYEKRKQFNFTLLYMLDQRIRILEAKNPITRLQFLNGLKQIYKDT